MDTSKRIEKLEFTLPVVFEILAGLSQTTHYLMETVLTPEQKDQLSGWLAYKSSETDSPGRIYLAQLGACLTKQERFDELVQIVGQEFIDQQKHGTF